MKPAKFDYLRAASLAEAHEALAAEGGDASIIAGGQTLVPLLSMRMARPKLLVDIMHVAELGGIAVEDNAIRVGAAVRQAALLAWPELAKRQPLLALALPWVGHAQTRARGTVCGSVALADPSAEIPLALVALGGEIELSSAQAGRRSVAADDFFTGLMSTAREDDELIEAVRFPCARPGEGYAFREFARRHGDFAIVACAGGRRPRKARGSRSAASPTGRPRGTSARSTARALDDALQDFAVELEARDDLHATADQRRDLVRKLGRVTIEEARAMPRLSAEQRHRVRLTLNGRAVEGDAEPRMLLTDFLRHVLGATGTHVGCEHGVCGACTIEIDGAPARACLTLAVQADGATHPHRRRAGARARPALGAAGGVPPPPRAAMRLLHARHPDVARHLSARHARARPRRSCASSSAAICAAAPATCRSSRRRSTPRKSCGTLRAMLDLGTSFLASVARDPNALAIVDGDVRLTYRQWYRRISALVAGFDELEPEGRRPSRHAAAEPLGGRDRPLGLPVRRHHRHADQLARHRRRARLRAGRRRGQGAGLRGGVGPRGGVLEGGAAPSAHRGRRAGRHPVHLAGQRSRRRTSQPRADAEAWSVMLYTSGTTAKPKGVPRRQRAERAAALAHVAQNLYRNGERTLGVMPLYHTMGVRSLLAMSLIGGTFVCLPRFDVARALELIAAREDHQSLSGADALSRPGASRALQRRPTCARCASSASPAPR